MKEARPCSAQATEYVVFRIWGKVILAANRHELCFFPQEVDDFDNEISSNAEPAEDSFVFRQNFFGDQPGKSSHLYPLTEK